MKKIVIVILFCAAIFTSCVNLDIDNPDYELQFNNIPVEKAEPMQDTLYCTDYPLTKIDIVYGIQNR